MRKESGRYSRRMVSVSELDCLSSKDTVEKLFPVSFISLVCIGSGMHLFSQTRAEVYWQIAFHLLFLTHYGGIAHDKKR